MLKRALPPAILVLSACTGPAPNPVPRPPGEAAAATRAEKPGAELTRAPDAPLAAPKSAALETVAAGGTERAHADPANPTRALFLANCAQCHLPGGPSGL